MPVTGAITLVRPSFSMSDSGNITPTVFNGVTLTSASVIVSGALAIDGSVPGTGTQSFQNLTASGNISAAGYVLAPIVVASSSFKIGTHLTSESLREGIGFSWWLGGANPSLIVSTVEPTSSIPAGLILAQGFRTINPSAPSVEYRSIGAFSGTSTATYTASGFAVGTAVTTTVNVGVPVAYMTSCLFVSTNVDGIIGTAVPATGSNVTVTLRNVGSSSYTGLVKLMIFGCAVN